MPKFSERLQHAWNAFLSREQTVTPTNWYQREENISYRADRYRVSRGNERTILSSIENRIAIDVSQITINHVRVDENDMFTETIDSGLNRALTVEANIDQTGREFIFDVVMSMLDEGCVAVVPVDTTIDPRVTGSYDILTLRTGKIISWKPKYVKVQVYNDRIGKKQEILLPKDMVAIIENPLYAVMNEPNSTLQRLIRKLRMLDAVDEQTSSGKLDIIIQLPYVVKTEARRKQAESRRKDIETQLAGSKYGIAYTDGTERITQLNRPAENNLLKQVEYLTSMLYSQLGLTEEIFNGTADEKVMLNYYNRTIEPIISTIVDNLTRKFLTKTARSQRQAIKFFRDPFRLVPVNQLADIADRFTRNEILTSNEVRAIIGYKPVNTDRANELLNKNISQGNLMPENLAPGYSSGEEEMEGYPYGEDQV